MLGIEIFGPLKWYPKTLLRGIWKLRGGWFYDSEGLRGGFAPPVFFVNRVIIPVWTEIEVFKYEEDYRYIAYY